jgi:hypothetical protein
MQLLMLDAFGLLDVPTAHWNHIFSWHRLQIHSAARLPETILRALVFVAWLERFARVAEVRRAATLYMIFWARRCGLDFSLPEIVRLDEALVVARWINETLKERGRCFPRDERQSRIPGLRRSARGGASTFEAQHSAWAASLLRRQKLASWKTAAFASSPDTGWWRSAQSVLAARIRSRPAMFIWQAIHSH